MVKAEKKVYTTYLFTYQQKGFIYQLSENREKKVHFINLPGKKN